MPDFEKLKKICKLLRYDILTSTTAAGSGHPTSSLSAVEIMATLMFGGHFKSDKLIFSKGHASPLLYSLYHVAGLISYDELMTLRKFGSRLEGHPTPRLPFVDVATGSLGQGLSVGVGIALAIRLNQTLDTGYWKLENNIPASSFQPQDPASSLQHPAPKVFVLLGDSELAEGQNWEAMEIASHYKLNNLIGILDVNRLGQRGETMLGWDLETYQKRIESFGWKTIVIDDGHDLKQINDSFLNVETVHEPSLQKPTMLIARTIKGKGVSFLENKDDWHGKTLNQEQLKLALKELGEVDLNIREKIMSEANKIRATWDSPTHVGEGSHRSKEDYLRAKYKIAEKIATRETYGDALASLGKFNDKIVVLDAETSNSTMSEKFKKEFPERFFEMFIAEQNMVSTALGFSTQGFIPFVSTFSAFLTRAYDQIRMAQYSQNVSDFGFRHSDLKIVGSHCGCSIGPDGASQMGLEDISMMRSILNSVVFYPSDAVSTFKLTELMAENPGIFYLRTTRAKTPVIYDNDEEFKIGGCKIHHIHGRDGACPASTKPKPLILTAGITLHEALKAQKELANDGIETIVIDCYSIKPIDEKTIRKLAEKTKNIIVVEDHYPSGGLAEAVLMALFGNWKLEIGNLAFFHLCVRKPPMSGTPEELLAYEEIDSNAIIKAVKNS